MGTRVIGDSLVPVEKNKFNRAYWLRFFLCSLLLLVTFEVGIRLFVVRNPRFEADAGFGGLVPRAGSTRLFGTEGFGVTSYFEHGEIATPYRDGVSVVVLGDSMTAAHQVPNDEKFVSIAEQGLRDEGAVVDLHNLGRPLQVISDIVYLAPSIIETYSPKVVIVQVSYSSFSLSLDSSMTNYYTLKDGPPPKLVHNSNSENLQMENIISSSGLLTMLQNRFYQIFVLSRLDRLAGREVDQFGRTRRGLVSDKQIVFLVRSVVSAYPDARIAFLVIPSSPEIRPGENSNISWNSTEDAELIGLISSVEGVEILHPLSGFQKLYEEQGILPRGFSDSAPNKGHLNKFGHQVIAKALVEFLLRILK